MSYIGANSQGIIGVANTDIIDGSTISNATLDSSVTFPAGTFTPVFKKLNTDTDAYVNNSPVAEGFYQRMGKLVHVTGSIKNDTSFSYNTGVASTDFLAIGGLPFNASLQSADDSFWNQGVFHIWFDNLNGWSASYNQIGLIRTTDDANPRNQIALYYYVANSTDSVRTTYYYSANSSIIFNGFYFTDD
jgi:hypothetical protein